MGEAPVAGTDQASAGAETRSAEIPAFSQRARAVRLKQPIQGPIERVVQPANIARGHEQLLLSPFTLAYGHPRPRYDPRAWTGILSTPAVARMTLATGC